MVTRTPERGNDKLSAGETRRDRVGRKLGRLVEITRIIDRNKDDSAFTKDPSRGNELIYVFDTNIVQTFLEPFRNPQYAELFHASIWGRDFKKYDDVNSQSCLLTAEYLFSGRLPGQQLNNWYMSISHYKEVRNQIEKLEERFQDDLKRMRTDPDFGAQVADKLAETRRILDPKPDRERLVQLAIEDEDDFVPTRKQRDVASENDVDSSGAIRNREIVRLFANDRIAEPIAQLRRFRSAAIAGRLRPIEQLFPPEREDLKELDDEVVVWRKFIQDVIDSRPHSNRTDKALNNDATTLAHISWATRRRASRNQRVVLVTGDKALYDAYRYRFIDEAEGQPFLLRPFTQYAPIFNQVEAKSSLSIREEAFDQVRQVVEAATLALNLSLFKRDESLGSRIRDHFILEAERSLDQAKWVLAALFPRLHDEDWLAHQEQVLDGFIEPLQRSERIMLGAYPELVASRLQEQRNSFLEAASHRDGSLLADAFEERLAEAGRGGFFFSVPLMPKLVADLAEKIRTRQVDGHVDRAPLVVRAHLLGSKKSDIRLIDFVSELAASGRGLPEAIDEMRDEPARIFALAASLAFNLELWNEAARFADLAAVASDHALKSSKPVAGSTKDTHYEYLYLKACSLRFRMASTQPNPTRSQEDPWTQWLIEAELALDVCIDSHFANEQYGRGLRDTSERAAVRLTYCAWFAFGKLSELSQNDNRGSVVGDKLMAACRDIAECEILRKKAENRGAIAGKVINYASKEMLGASTIQYRVNALAAKLIVEGLRELYLVSVEEAESAMAALTSVPQPAHENLPAIAQAYVLASDGDYDTISTIDTASLSLLLDKTIIQWLNARRPM